MPASPYRRGRLRQIEKWLRQEFPTPFPVVVQVLDTKGNHGITELYRGKVRIVLHNKHGLPLAADTLLHEWAHVVAWPRTTMEGYTETHSDEWALAYGRIYRAFFDDGGMADSRHFPVEKRFRRTLR